MKNSTKYCFTILVIQALACYSFGAGTKTHEEKCPFCMLQVLADNAHSDNRVVLNYNGKTQGYRCLYCAVADAFDLKGDVSIIAPSEKRGEPVTIKRAGGKWTCIPEEAVFAFAKGSHSECEARYHAVTNRAAFEGYAHDHAKIIGQRKALTFVEFIDGCKG